MNQLHKPHLHKCRGSGQVCEDLINLSVRRIFIYINRITLKRRGVKSFYAARRAQYFYPFKDNFSCSIYTPIFFITTSVVCHP